jgi:hypothetical protein
MSDKKNKNIKAGDAFFYQKKMAQILEIIQGAEVKELCEIDAIKPERGFNLLIKFNNDVELRVDGYISINKK